MKKRPVIAAYYFPNWHCDPRIEALHGKGWTEWEVVKHATPRFPGHRQPRVPLWGYRDESRPEVMMQKIAAAKRHGVDAFIFDWYCFNDGPYRQRCLDEGFLKAPNCQDIQFAMMWCNHNPIYVHPGSYWKPAEINWIGEDVTPETFRRETALYIEKYFCQPNYLRVDGGLYFSIYQPQVMVKNLGGEDVARELIAEFRENVRKAGLGELNLGARCDEYETTPGKLEAYEAWMRRIGFDSVCSYSWLRDPDVFPTQDYADWMLKGLAEMQDKCSRFQLPYSPACPVGWDVSPRTVQSDMFEKLGFPFDAVVVNDCPDFFEMALAKLKEMYDSGICKSEMLQIPCWNEWTEGAYLEPDTYYGYGYLEAIRNVFGLAK